VLKKKLPLALPTNEDEFSQMMELVDERLRLAGVQIPARSMEGWRVVSWSLGLGLSLFPSQTLPRPGVFVGDDLTLRILQWFKSRYGQREAVDFGLGLVAIPIRDDLWSVRMPRGWGTVNYFASRTEPSTTPDYYLPRRIPPRTNVLDQVLDLPNGLRHALRDDELADFFSRFMSAFDAMSRLESVAGLPMIFEAQGDLGAAFRFLMSRPHTLGKHVMPPCKHPRKC
jgi:hypothetical protein